MDISICHCGGLSYKCAIYGHLPGSIGHYHAAPQIEVAEVIWSGKDELLPDRTERWDPRISSMHTYDLDEGEIVEDKPRRPYNRTGKHIGRFSRTNPNAPHYKPTTKKASNG